MADQTAKAIRKTPDEVDVAFMRQALRLAHRGEGRVEPNPMVGCTIVKAGRLIGRGYHQRFGHHHAEVEAIAACTTSPRGATAYVTLEPCCHHGKTPPCTEALIRAGIRRVVAAVADPNPVVAGNGAKALRKAGIDVEFGVCQREAAELIAPYLTITRQKRPFVIAKWAQSLDGKLATRTGHSKWISCETSRRYVHRLRARVDAILVGAETARLDDPMLNARDVPVRRVAARVVLDEKLAIKPTCRLVATARDIPTIVATTRQAAEGAKAKKLAALGTDIMPCRSAHGMVQLPDCLKRLAQRGMANVMVEGGAAVLTGLLRANLVDVAHVFVAPMLIGGPDAPSVRIDRGCATVDQAITPIHVATRRSGEDMCYTLRFSDPMNLI